jgi:hypothetical protein
MSVEDLAHKIYTEMKRLCKNLNTDVFTKPKEYDRGRIQKEVKPRTNQRGKD